MKIFHKEENGKEVVFVQKKDVSYFITEGREIPLCILEVFYKDGVNPVDDDLREFLKIEREEAVRFFTPEKFFTVIC